MSQDDTPDLVAPPAGKVSPETVALRAQPRSVTRLNRRTLAVLAGGLSAAVLGATIWSLQPPKPRSGSDPTELYNVDRGSRSEGLDRLPSDYSKLLPPPPELGPPLPGDLGPAIVQSQRPATPSYTTSGHDPAEAERLARLKEGRKRQHRRYFSARAASAQPWLQRHNLLRMQQRWRASIRWPPALRRPQRNPLIQQPCRIGRSRKRHSFKPALRKPAIPGACSYRRRRIRSWPAR